MSNTTEPAPRMSLVACRVTEETANRVKMKCNEVNETTSVWLNKTIIEALNRG
jgi:hypothetical protein